MQVVILCGGLGTCLREETEFRPKLNLDMLNFSLPQIDTLTPCAAARQIRWAQPTLP